MNLNRAAASVASLIRRRGSTVTLGDDSTLKAIKENDPVTIARYVPVDAVEEWGKPAVVFYFSGDVYEGGTVGPGTVFTFAGLEYIVRPVQPNPFGDVHLQHVVVATRN